MSKKKRSSNGNTPRSRRPSSVPPSKGSSPAPSISTPPSTAGAASSVSAPLSGATTLLSGSAQMPHVPMMSSPISASAGPLTARSAGGELAAKAMELATAAAAAQAIAPEPSADAVPSREDDDQEESGPRIVSYVAPKLEATPKSPKTKRPTR
jgi:hypothetical protein